MVATRRMTLTLIIALLILLAINLADAKAHRDARRPNWIDPFAWAVAICETGKGHNHPDPQHQTSSYGGAWGWYVGTWQLDRYPGMPRFPWNATLRQQHRVFLRGRERGRYWGCIANGGYRSWI